jgi:hypothetical protein
MKGISATKTNGVQWLLISILLGLVFTVRILSFGPPPPVAI